MWQHSLGLRSHAFCTERQYQWDVNLHLTTNPSQHSLPAKAHDYAAQISSCSSELLAPVSRLLKLFHFSQSSCLSVFLFLFHYLVNMWLGHKSEMDLWLHLSAHPNAPWHPAPYYFPLQASVSLAEPPACLSACPSLQPPGLNEGQREIWHLRPFLFSALT